MKTVWLSPLKDMAVVEYGEPAGRRVVPRLWVVGVPKKTLAATTPEVAKVPKAPELSVADKKRQAQLLHKARRFVHRKKLRAAEGTLAKILSLNSSQPEALYWMAALAVKGAPKTGAIKWLQRLAASPAVGVPYWIVEARLANVFAPLRADSSFREAVGLDETAMRARTAYERVVGFGGTWEQPGVSCEGPEVSLSLRRKPKQAFRLVLKTTCDGVTDTTRLGGRWQTNGTSTLSLTFPNQDQDDEALKCRVATCESADEDCIHCTLDADLSMTLRAVRR